MSLMFLTQHHRGSGGVGTYVTWGFSIYSWFPKNIYDAGDHISDHDGNEYLVLLLQLFCEYVSYINFYFQYKCSSLLC